MPSLSLLTCYHRRRMLEDPRIRDVLIELLAEKIGTYHGICSGFVIMPDHAHTILWFREPGDFSRYMKSWKQTASLKLKKLLRGIYPNYAAKIPAKDPFWQPKSYPFNLYSERKAKEKLDYMHNNPVKAGLVDRAVDWKWSSARFYLLNEPSIVPLKWIF